MPISLRSGQSAAGNSTTTTATATLPSTPVDGNLLVAVAWVNSGGGLAMSGWTSAATGTAGTGSLAIFYKVAASDAATVTATSTSGTLMRVHAAEYTGQAASSLLDGTSTGSDSAAASVTTLAATTAGHTTTFSDTLLIGGWGFSANTSAWSVDSSFTLLQSNNRLTTAQRIVTAAGTFNPTLTWTTAARTGGVLAAFKAASAATPNTGAFLQFFA